MCYIIQYNGYWSNRYNKHITEAAVIKKLFNNKLILASHKPSAFMLSTHHNSIKF